ncbi:hypothetical protein AL064_20260 [Pseudomonas syringae pv. syringae]|uniref:hypothetical protein n=1 Tax=Pseudomonas syringae TaxID=317 RepID=UPI000760352E|nr:hypothetical protein [Pseudomonas syringae]KWS20259.1 hypothetical protein AL064_20260 [Pseudomonas syringae pv. syringae]
MNPDWNWFFSSLSQSAAAIVGIFGAFIITKIFSHQSVFIEKNNRIKQLLAQARHISETANSYNVKWYNDNYNESEFRAFHDHVDESFPDGEDFDLITEDFLQNYISNNSFSKYSDEDSVKVELRKIASAIFNDNIKTREEEELSQKTREFGVTPALPMFGSLSHMMSGIGLTNQAFSRKSRLFSSFNNPYPSDWIALNKTRDGLDTSYRDARHHARLSAIFLDSAEGNPESPRLISVALILVLFIFFSGVIYPLSFMPAIGAPTIEFSLAAIIAHALSFKGFLLTLISAAFTIIVAIFFTTNYNMKYSKTDINEIRRLTDVTSYCDSFKPLVKRESQE